MELENIKKQRSKELMVLSIAVILCSSLSIFRMLHTETLQYLFLNWNLFLAILPWLLSSAILWNKKIRKNSYISAGVVMIWLLFFPNAPYILTDLFHLKLHATVPVWYDLILILSYAWVALLIGFLSLWDIEKIIGSHFHFPYPKMLTVFLLFISSFGIYLGRFLRWNSWDILTQPYEVTEDIIIRIIHPFQHTTTWGVTLFMGIFLNLSYWSFRYMNNRSPLLNQ